MHSGKHFSLILLPAGFELCPSSAHINPRAMHKLDPVCKRMSIFMKGFFVVIITEYTDWVRDLDLLDASVALSSFMSVGQVKDYFLLWSPVIKSIQWSREKHLRRQLFSSSAVMTALCSRSAGIGLDGQRAKTGPIPLTSLSYISGLSRLTQH